jgi:alanine transaminase
MSINLCSNIPGQVIMACQSQPPKQGEPSYELWNKERGFILSSLKEKSKIIEEVLNQEGSGIHTQAVAGAMYAFPSLTMPQKAIAAAEASGQAPDNMWCMECLEETGVICVPGSGFGQKDGTHHFRITILPGQDPVTYAEDFRQIIQGVVDFNKRFLQRYAD